MLLSFCYYRCQYALSLFCCLVGAGDRRCVVRDPKSRPVMYHCHSAIRRARSPAAGVWCLGVCGYSRAPSRRGPRPPPIRIAARFFRLINRATVILWSVPLRFRSCCGMAYPSSTRPPECLLTPPVVTLRVPLVSGVSLGQLYISKSSLAQGNRHPATIGFTRNTYRN